MIGPAALILAEIGAKLLAPPVRAGGMRDRRKGRERCKHLGVAQRQRECTMPTHGMPGDAVPVGQRKRPHDEGAQLGQHIVIHAEMRRPGRAGGVDIEPRPLPQIIGRVIGHPLAPGRGVGKDHRQPMPRRMFLKPALEHGVFMGAGQPREIPQHRNRPPFCLRRQVEAKGHVAGAGGRTVPINALHTAEATVFREGLHAQYSTTARIDSPRCMRSKPWLI
jgi:hypothetical protein